MLYSNDEKTDMLFLYAKCNRNATAAKNMYSELYPERRRLEIKIFRQLERNLRDFGAYCKNKSKKYSVTRNAVNEANILGKYGEMN